MKVRIASDAISDSSMLTLLYDILRFFESGQHQWLIDDIEAIEHSQWVARAGEPQAGRILELLQKSVTEAAYDGAPHAMEIIIGTGEGCVHPSVAWTVLQRPAHLIVEDATSDGRFLRVLVHAYDHSRLKTALEEQWLVIDHAGGAGQVARRVETLIRERSANRRRIQALVDSDRLYPEHESDTIKAMRATEREHDVVVHVLHKRDSENYLPLDALAHHKHEASRFQKTYRAFCRLSPSQQDHFDMKHGFKANRQGEAELHSEQAELYSGVPKMTLRELVGGFGSNCGAWFGDDDEMLSYIDRTTMEARCITRPGELPEILAKIEEML